MLFEWRNDDLTVQNSINSNTVEWESHVKWLRYSLQSNGCKLLIAYHDGRAAGTVRFNYHDGFAIMSWTVAPDHRGKGIGAAMLKQAIKSERDKDLIAEIKEANVASKRIADNCGFHLEATKDGIETWRLLRKRQQVRKPLAETDIGAPSANRYGEDTRQ